MGLVEYLIGRFVRKRLQRRRRKNLRAELDEADLSEEEKRAIANHREYVVEHGTGGIVQKIALGFLALVGVGAGLFGVMVFTSGAPVFIWGLFIIIAIFFVGLSYRQYQKVQRASRIYELLTSSPRQLTDTSPDDY